MFAPFLTANFPLGSGRTIKKFIFEVATVFIALFQSIFYLRFDASLHHTIIKAFSKTTEWWAGDTSGTTRLLILTLKPPP